MARTEKVLLSFNKGEISPLLDARMDIAQLGFAARTLHNMVAESQGAAVRRAGTRFIASVKGTSSSGSGGGGGLRVLHYDSGPIVFPPVDHGFGQFTNYTGRWTLDATETAPGIWDMEVHGYCTITGSPPPFDAVGVQIQSGAVANSNVVCRLINWDASQSNLQDQLDGWSNPFSPPARAGSLAWDDTVAFTTYLVEFTPADSFVASFTTIPLLDMVV